MFAATLRASRKGRRMFEVGEGVCVEGIYLALFIVFYMQKLSEHMYPSVRV